MLLFILMKTNITSQGSVQGQVLRLQWLEYVCIQATAALKLGLELILGLVLFILGMRIYSLANTAAQTRQLL